MVESCLKTNKQLVKNAKHCSVANKMFYEPSSHVHIAMGIPICLHADYVISAINYST